MDETTKYRNKFYRDAYKGILGMLFLSTLIMIGLVIAIMYLALNQPEPSYFATTEDGKIVTLDPLSNPNVRPKVLLRWAGRSAVSSYSFDFVNFDKQLDSARQHFTTSGWRHFSTSLAESNMETNVKQNQLFVSAVVSGTPVIVNQGSLGGRYSWRVQVPLLVKYQSADSKVQTPYIIDMLIVRTATLDSAEGIGVEEFRARVNG